MKKADKKQIKRIWALIRALGMTDDNRHEMIYGLTNRRTDSLIEINSKEADELIDIMQGTVNDAEKAQRKVMQQKRRRVFAIMYELGWIDGTMSSQDKIRFINKWLWKHTKRQKNLNELDLSDLLHVIKQLEAVRRNYEIKQSRNAKKIRQVDVKHGFEFYLN